MLLPPWFEEKRAEIMAMLDPIVVPEGNIPKDAKKVAGGLRRPTRFRVIRVPEMFRGAKPNLWAAISPRK